MSDAGSRTFRRSLTAVLLLLGAVTAGAVFLFGHLLFRSLSKDVYNEALLHSRIDAERIARGVTEKAQGDAFTLKAAQREIDTLVGTAVRERRVLSNVSVVDRAGNVVYRYKSELERHEPVPPASPEGGVQIAPADSLVPPEREQQVTMPIADPYDIEIPIGDVFVLHVGLSRKELEKRVEKLRTELYMKTAAAAVASLLGIGAASAAVILLYRRTRRVEAAHREAERRAELGELAAGLAHEIRNPLNAMGLNLEILEEQLQRSPAAAPPATRELAQAARLETGRLNRLLTDFLAYARPAPIHTSPADLNEIAGEAVAFLGPEAERRRIRLEFRPHPGAATAVLDAPRVRQVVLNLVGNALDAVEAEGAAARDVTVSVDADGGAWRLTVADRGPGVPDGTLPDVFRAFVSTKPAGTGLGLPIAERIVRAHGGTLTLSSAEGGPTRAIATFPRAA